MTKRTILLTAVFATLLSAAFSVQAENYDYYWKGGSGNYFTQSNWELSDGTAAPVALDSSGNAITAYVQASGSAVTFDYSILGAAVRSLTIGGGSGSASVTRNSNSSLTIDSGKFISVLNNGLLTVQNTLIINANGAMSVNGGSLSTTGVDVSGTFDYTSGSNFVNSNTININAGGSFNIAGSGQFRMNGTYSIMNIMGGSVYIDSISYIGVTANGVINQSGGNATFNKSLVFGWGAGNGTYNLSAGTLTTTDNAGLWCSKTTGFNTFNMTGGTANFNKAGNSFAVGLYDDGTGTQWTPRSVANVFNLYSGTVNAANTFAIQYNGTLFVAKNGEDGGDGVLNAKAITLTNTGHLNMSSGTINVGEGGITSSDGAYSITLSGGTFGTKGSNWSSALNAGISSNAVTFASETGKTITWSGILSGAGGVTKSGDGTLTLVGANTYSGTTTISGGTLKLTGDGTLGTGAVVNEASLEFAYDTEKTFTNAVSGNGTVTKTGAGRLKINAANGFQASELIVSNGRLDFLGTMTGGITVSSNTVFSPGNSVGTADVNGLFTLGSGATLLLEVDGSESDLLKATSFDVASGTIDLEMGSVQSGRMYAIIQNKSGDFGTDFDVDFWTSLLTTSDRDIWELSVMGDTVYAKIDANAIPEPSTWLLLVLGTAGLFYWRKKK
ncbi:MAG: autotransporter-associated beta strand repeat-containing protein [Thermoguttaceae bacterium]|nr:autotransporter-associated beta strand repeat-containing protein [Thermoguttaceae bacterium]